MPKTAREIYQGKLKDKISINPAHKGELHRDLGVPSGTKLTPAELARAKHSKNPAVRKRANFAINAKSWH